MSEDEVYMQEAIALARQSINEQGGPFGAVIVRQGQIIGRGYNQVVQRSDPTAHAEVMAIREASQALGSFELRGCRIFSSCEPCPMCLSAIYWARLDGLTYAAEQEDAAAAGFDDAFLYRELSLPLSERVLPVTKLMRGEAQEVFQAWVKKEDKICY
jgi:guanine deaminase